MSRRRLLAQLVKGAGFGVLGASFASSGYLIFTGLL
jgi:hypothetical protein